MSNLGDIITKEWESDEKWLTTSTILLRLDDVCTVLARENDDQASEYKHLLVACTRDGKAHVLYRTRTLDAYKDIKELLDAFIPGNETGVYQMDPEYLSAMGAL